MPSIQRPAHGDSLNSSIYLSSSLYKCEWPFGLKSSNLPWKDKKNRQYHFFLLMIKKIKSLSKHLVNNELTRHKVIAFVHYHFHWHQQDTWNILSHHVPSVKLQMQICACIYIMIFQLHTTAVTKSNYMYLRSKNIIFNKSTSNNDIYL